MPRRRTPLIITAAALGVGLGAAAGAGGYAALGGDQTTTVVQQAPATGSPAAATKTSSVGSVYKAARAGVVEITTTQAASSSDSPFPYGGGSSGESRAQGSGFVFDSDGHVATNYHVVQGAKSISVTFADGSKYDATVVGTDPSSDLAVLKVDAPSSKLHPLRIGDSSALSVGDGVVAGVAVGVGVGVDVAPCTSNEPMSIRPLTTLSKPGPR